MGTLTSYVGALLVGRRLNKGSTGFCWINIMYSLAACHRTTGTGTKHVCAHALRPNTLPDIYLCAPCTGTCACTTLAAQQLKALQAVGAKLEEHEVEGHARSQSRSPAASMPRNVGGARPRRGGRARWMKVGGWVWAARGSPAVCGGHVVSRRRRRRRWRCAGSASALTS